MNYSIHNVANLFPMMTDEEFASLVEDIKSNGQHEPITIYQNQIIDGRNRYKACEQLGITPKVREWNGQGSLVKFVYSLNMKRRHLTGTQKATIAVEMLPLLEEEAKERQGRRTDLQHNIVEKIPQSAEDNKSRTQAAKLVGTNERYVSDAKKIKQDAPEVFELMKSGEVNMAIGKTIASKPEEVRKKVIDNLPNKENGTTSVCIHCGELQPIENFNLNNGSSKCKSCVSKGLRIKNSVKSEVLQFEGNPEGEIKFLKKKVTDLELKVVTLEKQLADERTRHMVERTELADEIFTIKGNLTLRGIEL